MKNPGCFCCANWAQILAVFTATIGVMSDGIHYGWSSPAIPVLFSEDSPVEITEDDAYWLEVLYWLGGIFGLPITILAVDRLGRKGSIIMASSQNLLSWILIGSANSKTILFVARFITGMAGNTSFVSAPMYIAECADAKIRGFLGTFIYTMMMVGTLLSYCVIPFVPIWASSTVGATINIIQILSFMWMPETPYYSLIKGKRTKAEKSLKWLRRRDNVEEELKDIESAVERQSQEKGRPQDLIIVPSNRKALLIMTMLNSTQHFCGISVMLMNVQTILQSSGSSISLELSAILFGACMLIALLAGSPFVDRFGRKILLITSCILSSLFLGLLGVYFFLKDYEHLDVSHLKAVPLIAVLAYAFSYRCGLGLVPIVVTGEIFPTSVKAMGMTLADLIYNLMAIISIKMYYLTSEAYGMHVPFLVFCCCGLVTAVCVFFFLPETKGKTLEQIQMKLKGNSQTKL